MAGDWIKMRRSLPRDPKVIKISSLLGTDTLRVVGALMCAWSIADELTEDGRLDHYTAETLDKLVGLDGLSEAMAAVGWLVIDPDFLEFPRFLEHNGNSAKRRAQDAVRKMSAREADTVCAPCPQNVRKMSANEADKMRTREEKRREEKNQVCAGSLGNSELWPPSPSPDAASGEAHQPTSTPRNAPRMPQDPFESSERTQTSAVWFEALKSRVNGLKAEWQKPARWSYAEDRLLADGVASQMDELDEADWSLLGRYLAANTSTDSTYWKPRTRGKFVETFPDVMESARRWAGKNGVAVRSTVSADLLNNPVYR